MAEHYVKVLQGEAFQEAISKGVAVVDFWAQWCMPCRMLTPILEKIAKKMETQAKIYKLNVDENREIAMEFNIFSIPTVCIFKNGEMVNQLIGLRGEDELTDAITEAIQS